MVPHRATSSTAFLPAHHPNDFFFLSNLVDEYLTFDRLCYVPAEWSFPLLTIKAVGAGIALFFFLTWKWSFLLIKMDPSFRIYFLPGRFDFSSLPLCTHKLVSRPKIIWQVHSGASEFA